MEYNIVSPDFIEFITHCRELADIAAAGDSAKIILSRDSGDCAFPPAGTLSPKPLSNLIYLFISACTLTCSACFSAGLPYAESAALSERYISACDSCTTTSQAQNLFYVMWLGFAARMEKISRASAGYPAVRRAIDYINEHYQSKISAEQLAAYVGYNRSHLAVMFRCETGLTITEYIRNIRIKTAKRLIAERQPLSDIAHLVGYSSQSHFCKSFRAVTGITPNEYRVRMEFNSSKSL